MSFSRTEINFRAGGAAGDGIASIGEILNRVCTRLGLWTFAYNSYQSVIRGGHVWYSIRSAENRVLAPGDRIDVLIAIDTQTIDVHKVLMNPGGVIVFDDSKSKAENLPKDVIGVPVPLTEIAKSLKKPQVQNTVAMGAAMYFFGLPLETLLEVLADQFGAKSQEIIDMNRDAALAGYNHVKEKKLSIIPHKI
ncbi:MAG TPA: 2-oxoacid:acceptor oxidoreductase family protein, partial [Candidatus Hodarchaeales archaeon]|nr:2-oxoacid:acceptor oxidoreductase family protein [Candidatus Hodarchaeales archaeon]